MMAALRNRVVSKLTMSMNVTNNLPDFYQSLSRDFSAVPVPTLMVGLRSFASSSIDGVQPPSASTNSPPDSRIVTQSADADANVNSSSYGKNSSRRNPPDPIPGRLLRGEKPKSAFTSPRLSRKGKDFGYRDAASNANTTVAKNSTNDDKSTGLLGRNKDLFLFDEVGADDSEKNGKNQHWRTSIRQSFDERGDDFLARFKLASDKGGKPLSDGQGEEGEGDQAESPPPEPQSTQPQDADEIFKKMKETGLIPNAVAMLDALCKDGLIQEAMKLFGLMREKGSIPEVVIYTAVVEGFCKAHKFDDAKRIFRKMQNNGISPNAFSYTVLVQGLYKGVRLDDALDFCTEMLEAGHSPNFATFTGLVDAYCKEKGVEEAQSIIKKLKQKGFLYDEKAAREYLDKKGPFLPVVWEAILGKKSSQRPF